MKIKQPFYTVRIIPVIFAALVGAMMVFSSYDDAPGGSLLGLLMIFTALFFQFKLKK